jgi:hypothetical protein
LKRIKDSGDIFMAWSDRPWVLEGASVRVSMVGFDDRSQTNKVLDGLQVTTINSDLTSGIDITLAQRLPENFDLAFMGVTPAGPFDITRSQAQSMLAAVNPSGKSNADVVRPYFNAVDITRRVRDMWTIDFGTEMSQEEAAQYVMPFEYAKNIVRPARLESKQPQREKDLWWIYTRSRPEMRSALHDNSRYIATPRVAKHRSFVWLDGNALVDSRIRG